MPNPPYYRPIEPSPRGKAIFKSAISNEICFGGLDKAATAVKASRSLGKAFMPG
jgi:hypothetical protein